ncbi:MAG: ABC transporter permease [bacterium]|nr:ABC transporter permease [bacterium]
MTRRLLRLLRLLAHHQTFTLGTLLVAMLIVAAFAAPLIAHQDPMATSSRTFEPPLARNIMGTDQLGRDLWAEVVYGARVSLTVGVGASLISTFIGLCIGVLAGYRGGPTDVVLMRVAEFFQVIPQFFLAIVLVALIGRGVDRVTIVLGVLGWPLVARIVRAQFLALRAVEFTEAARAIGAGDWYIANRVMLPHALPPVIVAATQNVSHAILLESGIAFFGLGDPNLVSWGAMLNAAQAYLGQSWWISVFPGAAIALSVIGFSLLGDGLNDLLNQRARRS